MESTKIFLLSILFYRLLGCSVMVWFICLMAYQLLIGYLMLTFNSFVKI